MSSQYPASVTAQIARSLEARRLPTRLGPVYRERSSNRALLFTAGMTSFCRCNNEHLHAVAFCKYISFLRDANIMCSSCEELDINRPFCVAK